MSLYEGEEAQEIFRRINSGRITGNYMIDGGIGSSVRHRGYGYDEVGEVANGLAIKEELVEGHHRLTQDSLDLMERRNHPLIILRLP